VSNSNRQDSLSRPITPGIIDLVMHGSFEDWLKSDRPKIEYLKRMSDLLDRYQIDPSLPDCWFLLAFELACDHEKGFTVAESYRGRGRPKKDVSSSDKLKKQRGRPELHTLEDAKELVRCVDGKKELLKQKEGRHITDKETLKILLTLYLQNTGTKGITAALAKQLPRYQRQLSEARNKIRENIKK